MSVLELVSVPLLVSVALVSVVSIATVESPAVLSESPPHPAAVSRSAATDIAVTMVRTIKTLHAQSALEQNPHTRDTRASSAVGTMVA